MVNISLHIILIVGLLICVFQDIKDRGIHVLVLICIGLLTIVLNYKLNYNWSDIGYSVLFLSVNISILFIFLSVKNKKMINLFENYLGMGDVVFFLAVIPLFSFRNFILYFIVGMFISMFFHLVFNKFQNYDTIPLAGYLSIFLVFLLAYTLFSEQYSFLKIDLI